MQPILTGVGRVPPQARGGCLACGRDIFVVGVGSPLVQSACVLIKPCFKRDGWGCFPTVSRLLRDSCTWRVRRMHPLGGQYLSLIHISEPTRLGMISYAVFCL